MLNRDQTSAELSAAVPDRPRLPAPLPGFRRYRCGGCQYQYETFGMGGPAPDQCGLCGRPWVAVSETVGPRAQAARGR